MKDEHPFWNFLDAKTNWPLLKIQIGILATIVFFFKPLLKLYTEYVINPVLSQFDNTNYTGAAFLILFVLYILLVVRKQIKNNYQVTANTLLLLAITSVYYFFFIRNDYTFAEPFNNGLLYYADILPLYFLYFLGLFGWNTVSYFKPLKNVGSTAIGFVTDEPISEKSKDLLNRSDLAKDIADKIKGTKYKEPHKPTKSYAIGINGKWGSGKTSFVNLIKENFQKDEPYIWINFKPWDSLTKEDVIANFFKTIRKAVNPYSSALSDNLKEYSHLLTNVSYKGIDLVLNSISKTKSISESCAEINKILSYLDKRIIVFIDDLDRLQKDEIVQVINLIRNTADFDNTVYIATYDKDYVSKAYEELSGNESQRYLEKIFQVEYDLPRIDSYTLRRNLSDKLREYIGINYNEELTLLKQPVFSNNYPCFDPYIISIRDVNRFINIFVPHFLAIKDNIDFIDYFNLTLIQCKYSSVIKVFFDRKSEFLESQGENYIIKIDTTTNQSIFFKYLNESQYKDNANLLINSIGDLFNYTIDPPTSLDYLQSVMYKRGNRSNRILNKNSFYRYSTNCIFSGDISEEDFKKIIELDYTDFIKTCKLYLDMGARNRLIIKLEKEFYTNNFEIFKKVISAIIELSLYTAAHENSSANYYSTIKLLDSLKRAIGEFPQKDFEKLLMDILTNEEYYDYNRMFIHLLATKWSPEFDDLSITVEEVLMINVAHIEHELQVNQMRKSLNILSYTKGVLSSIDLKLRDLYKDWFLKNSLSKLILLYLEKDGDKERISEFGKFLFDGSEVLDFIKGFSSTIEQQKFYKTVNSLVKRNITN
jgi:hypothetical protein